MFRVKNKRRYMTCKLSTRTFFFHGSVGPFYIVNFVSVHVHETVICKRMLVLLYQTYVYQRTLRTYNLSLELDVNPLNNL